MNDYKFKDGMKLKSVFLSVEEEVTVGRNNITEITIVMQHGQMSEVPWAKVTMDGTVYMYNLALVQGVKFLQESEGAK
jgi:hypothetical protein